MNKLRIIVGNIKYKLFVITELEINIPASASS